MDAAGRAEVKSRRPWIITPHDAIEKLEDNLWTVRSPVPGVPMDSGRRMGIVKLTDGKLLFFHAIPLDEATLAEVKAWGTPAYLVVPHDNHCVDADAFSKKLGLKIFGPKENEAGIRKRVDLEGTLDQLPRDPSFELVPMGGTKKGEVAMVVRHGERKSIMFADAYMNMPKGPLGMRLAGFVGPHKSPPVFRFLFVRDQKALKGTFEQLAKMPEPLRLVPCHGDITHRGGSEILRKIAARL